MEKNQTGQTKVKDPVSQLGLGDESRVEDVSPQQEEQDTLKCPICSRENCDEDHESTFLFHEDQYKDHYDEEHIKLTQELDEVQCLTISKEISQFKRLKTVTIVGMKLDQSCLPNLFQCSSIRSLKLSNCQLGNIPRSLAKLKDLEFLDLSHNNLTTLPSRPLPSMICLKSLNVSHNKIEVIGDVVKKLRALQNFDVSHNSIAEIPYGILEMGSLEAFSCSNNKIAKWLDPPNAENRKNVSGTLKYLNLSNNLLTEVPQDVKELKNLSVVNLSHNKIGARVPDKIVRHQIAGLFYLPSVSTLWLSNNKIKRLPSVDVTKVSPNIEFVDLSNNKIGELPSPMLLLSTLKVLLLGGNKITQLPTDLDLNKLSPTIRVIDLSDNTLEDLPLVLCFLRSLEKLDLKQNLIRTISANVRSCKSLSFLNVSHNRLREISSHVIGLPNLVEIHASHNQITSVSHLQRDQPSIIEVIALADNGLSHFPAALLQMGKLKKVDLRNNEIQEIPESIIGMSKGVTLYLQDNPIVDPPLQVCQAGLPAIQAFYEDLTTASSITQCLKTLFLGTYEAGKTSLVKVFQFNCSSLTRPEERTHGIEIAELHLSAPNTPDITLSVWDFAGQETYYMTHQFFLSAKALMLLVVNLEKYDPDNFPSTCGNWLKNMIAKVRNPIVIPVATHIDKLAQAEVNGRCEDLARKLAEQERMRIEDLKRQLKRIHESSSGLIATVRDRIKQIESLLQKRPSIHPKPVPVSSAESLEGIQYLKQVILNYAVNKEFFPEVGRPIPKAWADAEACVERKGKELSMPYMTWDEFMYLLKENVPNLQSVSRIKTVAQYLHDTGKILWYSEIESLQNHVFLKPASLVDIFRKVIRHDLETFLDYRSDTCYREAEISSAEFQAMKNDLVRKGILHTKLLRCLWSDVEKECHSGTFNAIFHVLIELMRQFDLCYDLEEQEQVANTPGSQERWLLSWHDKRISESKTRHHISRRLLLPWHIKDHLEDMTKKAWTSVKTPTISLQYQFPTFVPPGLFARLTVRAHRPKHNLHFVSHWNTGTLCKHKKSKTLVLLEYEDVEGFVVSLSARPESHPDYRTYINLWGTLKELSLEVEDLLKQWPGVQFDRLTVCPECHQPTFPGSWLHPPSRWAEEEICSNCNERVSVGYLIPPSELMFQGRIDDAFAHLYHPIQHDEYSTFMQHFADLQMSNPPLVTSKQLLRVAKKLGSEWENLAIHMGFSRAEVYRFKHDNRDSTLNQIFEMLVAWKEREGRNATKKKLQRVLTQAEVDIDVISCLHERERSYRLPLRAREAYEDTDSD